MGLMGRPRPDGAAALQPPRRPKRVSIQTASFLLPSSPLHGALPARLVALAPLRGERGRQRAGGPRGVVGELASGPLRGRPGDSTAPVYARPLPRSRPHQQSGGTRYPRSTAREGGRRTRSALAPAPTTKFVL
jgi:hypothetical protein